MIEPSVGVNPVMPGWPGFVSAFPYGLLTLNTAPTQEPLTLRAAKQHLRLPMDQTDEDDVVKDLIVTARQIVERLTERALMTQTWTLYLDSFPWWRSPVLLPKPPCASVVSVKYYDTDNVQQTWDPSNYIVIAPAGPVPQRAQIVPAPGVSYPLLPSFALTQRRPDAVQIQFTCGWASATDVPAPLVNAMKVLVWDLFEQRGSVDLEQLARRVSGVIAEFLVVAY